jgi:alkaline phosphatase D
MQIFRKLLLFSALIHCGNLICQSPYDTLKDKSPDALAAGADLFEGYAYFDTVSFPATIAFGSCNNTKHDFYPALFNDISAQSPNIWIWLGDIVYADTTNLSVMASMYRKLKKTASYKRLRQNTTVLGIWDDHDYGINDGGKNHPIKQGAKQVLMDFLDVPRHAPVRKREGAYQSYTFGSPPHSVKIIILDTRYFRDDLVKEPGTRRNMPNPVGDILGNEQWAWLERELADSKANLNILVSSIQVLSEEHRFEKWANFPMARKRLLSLVTKMQPKNLLILSGDRHMAEISRMDLVGLPYPLYDFTSSGMTHTRPNDHEANKYRLGETVTKKNFGLLQLSWINEKPMVRMQIRGPGDELYIEETIKY